MKTTASPTRRRAAGFFRLVPSWFARSARFLAVAVLAAAAGSASAQSYTWTQRDSPRNWTCAASSGNGTKLVAGTSLGGTGGSLLYFSTDSGATWLPKPGAGQGSWSSVASSSDGQRIIACASNYGPLNGVRVVTTADGGANWNLQETLHTQSAGGGIWASVASSSSGQKLIATKGVSGVWVSTDFGATWNQRTPVAGGAWTAAAVSGDGTRLAAAYYGAAGAGGLIYTSINNGTSWLPGDSTTRIWEKLAISDNGSTILASTAEYGEFGPVADFLYKTSNSGTNWTAVTSAGQKVWRGLACDSTGMKLAATEPGVNGTDGKIWTSDNGGTNWISQDTAGARGWAGVASSSDGRILLAAVPDGFLWTGTLPAAPTVTAPPSFTVTEDVAGNLPYTGTPFADIDSTSLTVTLSIPDGTLSGTAGTGITVGGTATARTFSGTIASLNAYFTTAGKITYLTALNNTAVRTLTTLVSDGGLSSSVTSTINITAVNDAPALAAISVSGSEDTTLVFTAANFTSAFSDPESTALSSITVISLPTTGTLKLSAANVTAGQVIPTASLGSLNYVPAVHETGAKTFTVTASDGSLSSSPATTVTMTLAVVNDAPTLDVIANPAAINEDAAMQTVTLTGISAGGGETQTLTVAATSNNTGLIPNPTVAYTSPNATGTLTYTPVANAFGSATITVTVSDGQGTNSTVSRTFTIAVTAVNDAPTLAAIANPAAINEDAAMQTVALTGIGAGPGESQTLTVAATSSNTGLIPNPTVTYTSPNATGTLTYTPVANASGSATITVTVGDGQASNNTASRTFTIAVTAVNDAPTLDAIANPAAINEDAAMQTVALTGISAGGGEIQTLTVTATSGNPTLIPNPTVNYTTPGTTGSLTYTPVANASGTAQISVSVSDSVTTVTKTFTVTVNAVNDMPSFTKGANQTLVAGTTTVQTVPGWATAIDDGDGPVTQGLTFTVSVTSGGGIFTTAPAVAGNGTLTFTPNGSVGSATASVTLTDDATAGGGALTTAPQTFTITTTPNQPPSFTLSAVPLTLSSWGYNGHGILGIGVLDNWPASYGTSTPGPIIKNDSWQSVACAARYSMGIDKDGALWVWGQGGPQDYGTLGVGRDITTTASPLQIGTDTNWQSVTCGLEHTLGIKRDGTLWVWGRPNEGQVGNGVSYQPPYFTSLAMVSSPLQIGTDTNWQSGSCGEYHSVGIKKDGTLWAWGTNDYGQLGDGTAGLRSTPAQMGTDVNWQSVACGGRHTVGIKRDGTLWAWGLNDHGQLGDASNTNRPAPVQIGTDTTWQSVACGLRHTVGLKKNGTLWAWGRNNEGEIGDNSTTNRLSPTQIGTDTIWQSAACGYYHTLGIKKDATLWAWGGNEYGQLGDGSKTNRLSPVQIAAGTDWQSVACGEYHSIGLPRANDVFWAKNGPQRTMTAFAGAISAGDAGQTVSFTVTNSNTSLFSSQPAISANGTLTFTPASNATGYAVVTVTAQDNGGTVGGGQNTSPPQTFVISIVDSVLAGSVGSGAISLVGKVLINDAAGTGAINNAVTLGGSAGLYDPGSKPVSLTGPVSLSSDTSLNVVGTATVSGAMTSNGHTLTKTGPGKLVLDGCNFNGNVIVLEGVVEIMGANTQTCVEAKGTSVVQGNGTASCIIIRNGSKLNPGASPGKLTAATGPWEAGGVYVWEINKADGGAGVDPGWDFMNFTGVLALTPVPDKQYWISLRSLTTANVPGPMTNFNKNASYAWKIASASGGITGFTPDFFALDATGMRNDTSGSFDIALQNSNRDLVVTYTPSAPVALPAGAVSWYRAQNSAQDSVSTNHATDAGTAYTTGKVGQAFALTGAGGSYLNCTNNASLQLGTGTVEAWIKTANAGSTYRGIMVKQLAYGLFLENNNLIGYDWGGGGGLVSSVNLADNNWHHVALTFTTGAMTLYADGAQVATRTNFAVQNQNNALVLGAGDAAGTSQNFNGQIDEATLYNRVLSAAEIQSIFNAGAAGKAAATPAAPKDFLLTRNGANYGFSFTSVAGFTYTLWQSDTLAAGSWTNTGQPAITGDGTAKTMTLPAPAAGVRKRYYRLQVQ